jgi:Flp pilus assembly protein TadD
MALKSHLLVVLLQCTLVAGQTCLFAQSGSAVREAHPASSPYSTEESSAATPALARRESDLRTALVREPGSADLLYSLGMVLRQEGKSRESLDTYTQAARYRKPSSEDLRSVAIDYVVLSDYDDAIHWLELAAQMEPNDVDILYALGRCYYSKDRYVDAGKMFERVLAIKPAHLKAEENLGLVYEATNQPEKAEAALKSAASWANASGTDQWPFLDFGTFLLDQDRPKDAIDPLRIAVHIRAGCAACHEELGRALLANHESDGGIAELNQATQLDPKNPKTHYELGRALRQAGQLERAQQEFALSQKLYTTHSQE